MPTATAVTDQATLSGTNASVASGSVTYNVYSESNCSDLVGGGTAEPITTPGTLPASAPVPLDNAGTYYWQASYSGDTYHSSSTSSCGSESETVTAQAPVPTVAKVSPTAGPTGGGTPITITGTGFVSGATVVIGQRNGTTGAVCRYRGVGHRHHHHRHHRRWRQGRNLERVRHHPRWHERRQFGHYFAYT